MRAALTRLILVSRPGRVALREAARTEGELRAIGVRNLSPVINGIFQASDPSDPVAAALAERGGQALADLPPGLANLPRSEVPLRPFGIVGVPALRALFADPGGATPDVPADSPPVDAPDLASLLPELERRGHGVIMAMGKGGVGKTSVAVAIAVELARRGHPVHLTTTDPAAHVQEALGGPSPISASAASTPPSRLAPTRTRSCSAGVQLDTAGRALLEEDLRSPCTEEIAVFQAFARVVDDGEAGFVVIDTAPPAARRVGR